MFSSSIDLLLRQPEGVDGLREFLPVQVGAGLAGLAGAGGRGGDGHDVLLSSVD